MIEVSFLHFDSPLHFMEDHPQINDYEEEL